MTSGVEVAPLRYESELRLNFEGNLDEREYKNLCRDHTHKHGERIHGRVGHGRSIVASCFVGIGECRGVGSGTREQTHDGAVVELKLATSNHTHNNEWNERDEEAIEHPACASCIKHGSGKVATSGKTHRGEEKADANFAQHEVGRR